MPGSIVVPNEALKHWANAQINDLPTMSDMWLRMFVAELDVGTGTKLVDDLEPIEATFAGYGALELTDWTVPIIVGDAASSDAAQVTFVSIGMTDEIVYGLYATNGLGNKLWWAVTLTTPVPVPSIGNIDVLITLLMRSIYSS